MTLQVTRRQGHDDHQAFQYVVIGAGPCGGRAAAELARIAGPGSVCLIGEEAIGPYERPRLSKQSLTVPAIADPAVLTWASDDLVTRYLADPAIAVDTTQRVVETASGRRIGYDRLLIATGARARTLDMNLGLGAKIHYLRNHADAAELHQKMHSSKRVLVIGGGFIGLEVAASARTIGLEVVVAETSERLMSRVAPLVAAQAVLRKFETEGVTVHLGDAPISIQRAGTGYRIWMRSGLQIDTDLVVAGVGSVPNVELAKAAGLDVDNGILVNQLGATSDPNVFAAGDVANRVTGTFGARQRQEAWEPALDDGVATAALMAGENPPNSRAPWIWSDQFNWNLQMVGNAGSDDIEFIRGDPRSDSFLVGRIANDETISAAFAINAGPEMAMCRRAIAYKLKADTIAISDMSTPLRHAFYGP